MIDKELLELAANAAGYDETKTCVDEWFWVLTDENNWQPWNPLTDDGDALRLAVQLNISVHQEYDNEGVDYTVAVIWVPEYQEIEEPHGNDIYAATRRVIVKAAAVIGKAKGKQA